MIKYKIVLHRLTLCCCCTTNWTYNLRHTHNTVSVQVNNISRVLLAAGLCQFVKEAGIACRMKAGQQAGSSVSASVHAHNTGCLWPDTKIPVCTPRIGIRNIRATIIAVCASCIIVSGLSVGRFLEGRNTDSYIRENMLVWYCAKNKLKNFQYVNSSVAKNPYIFRTNPYDPYVFGEKIHTICRFLLKKLKLKKIRKIFEKKGGETNILGWEWEEKQVY